MTLDDFRRIALSMPGVVEVSRLGQANFRVGRKTFATMEGPNDSITLVRLTPDQQAMFIAKAPAIFAATPGGWGRMGTTIVQLEIAEEVVVQEALATAWSNVIVGEN
jgi:hypothetical protein